MTTATDSRIEACNQVIDHLMECLELAAGCGMGYSSIRAALDVANTHRVRVQGELDAAADEPETRKCRDCNGQGYFGGDGFSEDTKECGSCGGRGCVPN